MANISELVLGSGLAFCFFADCIENCTMSVTLQESDESAIDFAYQLRPLVVR